MAKTKAQAKANMTAEKAKRKKTATAKATAKRRAGQKKRVRQKITDKAAGIKSRPADALFGEGAMGGKAREHSKKVKRNVGY